MAENNQSNSPGGRGPGRGPNRGPGRGPNRGPRQQTPVTDDQGREITEKIIFINRSSKVVKGGRRFNFSALMVSGDKKGRVGLGMGKASEVADAIRKAGESAKTQLTNVSLHGSTIPHEVLVDYDGARVLMRPASPGTGIIAGKTVRAVAEAVGIKDLLCKSLGSNNAANVAKAAVKALLQLRLREEVYAARGIEFKAREETPVVAEPVEEAETAPAEEAAV